MATTNPQVMYAMVAQPHAAQYEYCAQASYVPPLPPYSTQYAPPPPLPMPAPVAVSYEQNMEAGIKRPAEEAWGVITGPKRPRSDSVGVAGGIFPQRPGEKMCAYYMTTRTCSFGVTCRFDHPAWVPAGGIPNWKEVTASATPIDPATLPHRPSEPDCAYFMKTGECRYGTKCRFNHPKEKPEASNTDDQTQHHAAAIVPFKINPSTTLNSKGLPLRPGEGNCVFYGKTGSCKYGTVCRYNHPEITWTAGRTGATLQPQQAVYVQPQQQATVQYQLVQPVQATQEYAYPTASPVYPNATPAYTSATPVYPNAAPAAYPSATPTYTTTAAPPAYSSNPPPAYPTQQVIQSTTEYVYPAGTTTMQAYPAATATQAYPAGTTTQPYPSETITQTYPPGTTAQTYPPGTAMEYAYPAGQAVQAQTEYGYPTPAAAQHGAEYGYTMEQPAVQAATEYAYPTDASAQQTAAEYAYTTVTPVQAPQDYAYAAAQAYHQTVAPVQAVYSTVAPVSLPHPQRPGEPDCTFYIKTGDCSFGATCKFNHPPDRIPTGIPKPTKDQSAVKLSLAGLPRRENESPCAYYMKTGTCKFGLTCKFDHPPPQEVIARAVEAARGELPPSFDVNLPAAAAAAEIQDTTPLPPGTDAPAVTAAAP